MNLNDMPDQPSTRGVSLREDAPLAPSTSANTAVEPPERQRGNTLREVLTHAFHDRRRIGLAFLVPFIAAMVLSYLPSPRYVSEATLLLRLGREYFYKPETGESNAAQPMAYDREQTLRAEVEILMSRDVKEAVIARIGLARAFPQYAGLKDPIAQRDAAVLELQRRFDASLIKDSNVLQLKFTHRDAQVAADMLNAIIAAYIDRRRSIFNTSSTVDAQADVSVRRARLAAIEQELETLKQTHNIQSFGEQQSLLLAQRQSIEMRLAESDLALAQSTGRSGSLQGSLSRVPASVELSSETQRSDAIESARKTLLDLKLKERDLSSKFTDQNLAVQDVRADITRTQAFLRDLEQHPNRAVKTGRSPLRDSVEADLVRSQADRRQADASRATLTAQKASIEERLAQLSTSARTLAGLERERRLVESAYEAAARRLQDETVMERLDQRRKSNVSIVQAARPPLEASSLRGMIQGVGFLLSLCTALLVAFVSALWRDTYLTPEEVQRSLKLPLLATLPRVGG